MTADPRAAVEGVDCVVTDTWVSMGDTDHDERLDGARGLFQVDEALMALAATDAVFLHCLPAHRGEEVYRGGASTGRSRWCGTRPRTASTPRRRSWPGRLEKSPKGPVLSSRGSGLSSGPFQIEQRHNDARAAAI